MTQQNAIKIFEEKKVRTVWDEETETWYFSIIDVIAALTDSVDPRKYWNKLKQRLKEEGNETVTNCHQLKMKATDGKMRLTDVADTEQLFRLIQSIPSPKAEPFKLWIAQVAKERLDQMQDPELSVNQALMDYKRLGYSNKKCYICIIQVCFVKSQSYLSFRRPTGGRISKTSSVCIQILPPFSRLNDKRIG